ncbi:unnamed protein product [Discosporangium mesarthrocarpum]
MSHSGLMDFWSEPWTFETWSLWSSQGAASAGLSILNWKKGESSPWSSSTWAPPQGAAPLRETLRASNGGRQGARHPFGRECQIAPSTGHRTIELLPTDEQRQTLQKWFGVVRWTHNRAVDALRRDPEASKSSLWAAVAAAESDHSWVSAVPRAVRDDTVGELWATAAACGRVNEDALKYRTRKDRLEKVIIRASGFLGGVPYPEYFGRTPLAASELLPDRLPGDAILVRNCERFFLCVPNSWKDSPWLS